MRLLSCRICDPRRGSAAGFQPHAFVSELIKNNKQFHQGVHGYVQLATVTMRV